MLDMRQKTIKMWVDKTNLRTIRPAEIDKKMNCAEMVAPGQFAKPGDMVLEGRGSWEDNFLIREKDFPGDYIEIRVPVDCGG